jgi:antitoxin component of MazEF toxin-antitoxin module
VPDDPKLAEDNVGVADLDAMLDKLDAKTFHEDIDFGPPEGNEIW